jgi:DNA-binding GntR family transcriptional regulator
MRGAHPGPTTTEPRVKRTPPRDPAKPRHAPPQHRQPLAAGADLAAEPTAERKGRGWGVRTVYATLKSEILDLTLSPGEPLDETRLSERFAMSRTPIREALVRLAGEELVTTLPNRNTIVTPIDFVALPEFLDALTLMYRATTRTAALRRTPADLDAMRAHQRRFMEAVANQDALAMISSNRDLHLTIAEAGRNRYYTDLFRKLLDEGRRMLRIYYRTFGDRLPAPYVAEHDAMINAIERQDVEEADLIAGGHAAQIVQQLQRFVSAGSAIAMKLGTLPAPSARSRASMKDET